MQDHHTRQQYSPPTGFASSPGTATYPQNPQQTHHQSAYHFTQRQQAPQQGTPTRHQAVYIPRQKAQQTATVARTSNERPMNYYSQPGAGIVIQGNTRPQIDCRTRESNRGPKTSLHEAHEQLKTERTERFNRLLQEERRVVPDRRANKTKKFHIMNIIAPFSALAILIAGFFAIFNPLTINNRFTTQKSTEVNNYPTHVQQVVSPVESEASVPQISSEQKTDPKPVRRVIPRTRRRSGARRGVASPNKIMITSYPSGALVSANGRTLGRTPYTWYDPSIYGMVMFAVEKNGYVREQRQVEFTGGTLQRNFVLIETQETAKETAAPPPIQTARPVPQNTPAQPAAVPAPTRAARVVPKPRGPHGVIFLSSLPPNADVFFQGKKIGRANTDLTLPAGTHSLTLVKDDKQLVKQLTVMAGKNPSQLVRLK